MAQPPSTGVAEQETLLYTSGAELMTAYGDLVAATGEDFLSLAIDTKD